MNTTKIIINGRFLEQKITGVQRYALEITKALDDVAQKGRFFLAVPRSVPVEKVPALRNIEIVRFGKGHGIFWEQISFAFYARHNRMCPLNFCNESPFLAPKGVVTIHDITYKVNPQFITTWRLRLIQAWHNLNTWYSLHHSRAVITVSEFSKKQIVDYYHIPEQKITVVYNAWQHFCTQVPDISINKRFPALNPKKYYFSFATMAKNKNFKWVLDTASLNPEETFVIAGSMDVAKLGVSAQESKNISYLGYVSDEDAKLLMKQCKAFLFPSLYEGFGIPPLEALAMGAPVVCSTAASLPEVFGNSVHYINPHIPQHNLSALLDEKIAPADSVLSKFSWKKSAGVLLHLLDTLVGKTL